MLCKSTLLRQVSQWRFSSTATHSSLNRNGSSTVLRYLKYSAIFGIGGVFTYYYALDSRAAVHRYLIMPLVRFFLDAEQSHHFTLFLAKYGLLPWDRVKDDPCLEIKLFSKTISNPVGMAAGFDKNGEAIDGLFSLGFGLVEIGTVTPEPQAGNPKPRLFRLEEDQAAINRYGFNSLGAQDVYARLRGRLFNYMRQHGLSTSSSLDKISEKSLHERRILGINLGKNKWSEESSNEDYVKVLNKLGPFADYVVLNVSSPNTPGLRNLQRRDYLKKLILEVKEARDALPLNTKPPLLVKIAPDLSDEELEDVSKVATELNVDGVIISNTTIKRPSGLHSDPLLISQSGGLSGKPLINLSLPMVAKFYRLTEGKIPIIGCGGISSGEDAVKYLEAGASAIQIYTTIAYEGPGIVRDIKDHLVETCKDRKLTNINEIVGSCNSLY